MSIAEEYGIVQLKMMKLLVYFFVIKCVSGKIKNRMRIIVINLKFLRI